MRAQYNLETPDTGSRVDHFVYSPASSYPTPYARLIDRAGTEVHSWSNDAAQPPVEDDPPSFLRGWNHVEVDADGSLYAMVPLRALLKLDKESNLLWQADISAHHDLKIAGGEVYVLTESPRRITLDGRSYVILDNAVTVLDRSGRRTRDVSLYDVVNTDPAIAAHIRDQVLAKHAELQRGVHAPGTGVHAPGTGVDAAEVTELLASATHSGPLTRALQLLRQLPGSPCDVLHTNAVELLDAHPAALWDSGHVLVSLRNLDLVAVVDLDAPRVMWSWGEGELSGQHQPSALPSGNLLVFDNGMTVGRSRVLEVDPATRTIAWEYLADSPGAFFSALASGCERLPGGNVLVTDAQAGRVFEVTRDKRIAWEWTTAKLSSSSRTSRVTLYRMAGVPAATVERILGPQQAPASAAVVVRPEPPPCSDARRRQGR